MTGDTDQIVEINETDEDVTVDLTEMTTEVTTAQEMEDLTTIIIDKGEEDSATIIDVEELHLF